MAGPEYARLNTGVSITRGNSANGALPTRESEGGEDEDDARSMADALISRLLSRNNRLHTGRAATYSSVNPASCCVSDG